MKELKGTIMAMVFLLWSQFGSCCWDQYHDKSQLGGWEQFIGLTYLYQKPALREVRVGTQTEADIGTIWENCLLDSSTCLPIQSRCDLAHSGLVHVISICNQESCSNDMPMGQSYRTISQLRSLLPWCLQFMSS